MKFPTYDPPRSNQRRAVIIYCGPAPQTIGEKWMFEDGQPLYYQGGGAEYPTVNHEPRIMPLSSAKALAKKLNAVLPGGWVVTCVKPHIYILPDKP